MTTISKRLVAQGSGRVVSLLPIMKLVTQEVIFYQFSNHLIILV